MRDEIDRAEANVAALADHLVDLDRREAQQVGPPGGQPRFEIGFVGGAGEQPRPGQPLELGEPRPRDRNARG